MDTPVMCVMTTNAPSKATNEDNKNLYQRPFFTELQHSPSHHIGFQPILIFTPAFKTWSQTGMEIYVLKHCDNYLAIFLMLGLEDVLFDRRRQDSALMLMFAKFSVSFILILDQFL